MNPVLKLFMIIVLALEISFTHSITLNIAISTISLVYLIIFGFWKRIAYLLLITCIPAIGIYMAQKMHGTSQYGILLVTRLYAFTTMGSTYTCKTSIEYLAASLEQNFKLPTKFAYGVMGAFNLTDTIKQEVADIKLSAQMRNISLHYWSPTLYFKAILAAMNWSSLLAQGMNSHLLVENNPRSHYKIIQIKSRDYLILLFILGFAQIILFKF